MTPLYTHTSRAADDRSLSRGMLLALYLFFQRGRQVLSLCLPYSLVYLCYASAFWRGKMIFFHTNGVREKESCTKQHRLLLLWKNISHIFFHTLHYFKNPFATITRYGWGYKILISDIQISHTLRRKTENSVIIAKFCSHKVKTSLYKAWIKLLNIKATDLFPSFALTVGSKDRLFLNENLTKYQTSKPKMKRWMHKKCVDNGW